MPDLPTFQITTIERYQREITTWEDQAHAFGLGDLHVALRRDDGRELHLNGQDAADFLRLIAAPYAWQRATAADRIIAAVKVEGR